MGNLPRTVSVRLPMAAGLIRFAPDGADAVSKPATGELRLRFAS